ncbi:MAG: peroxidase [Caulobacter sp.]|nr:peroxidase [Caulobacter sp.]
MADLLDTVMGGTARLLSRFQPWHKYPTLVAVATLAGLRVNMRHENLFNTETDPQPLKPAPLPGSMDVREARTADGSFNDLAKPWMGMADARFGRNMPIERTFGEADDALMEPNPRTISNRLLARKEFVPVPHLNTLAAAWLQFMVHDWLSHGENNPDDRIEIPLPDGDSWPDGKMEVLKTLKAADRAGDVGRPQTYTNVETHWWDASQIYGSSLRRQILVRSDPITGMLLQDGKLALTADGHLPLDVGARIDGLELAGVNGNWWVGLSVMHTLFVREHNAVVDRLKIEYPAQSGEWLFQKARLVISALLAKIHTVEWTPALMNSPEGRLAMRANWWGLAGETFYRAFGRGGESEILFGVAGSPVNHHAAPYAMTEEFAACYRMHPLMPDDYDFRRHGNDATITKRNLIGVARGRVSDLYKEVDFTDVLYSLATSHPGALCLHNYPNTLRELPPKRASDVLTDLAATDILRDRERGVPRYCEFRRHMGMRVPKTFADLTDNKDWQKELKEIYGDVKKVDLLVGTLAESQCSRNGTPPGFGFSDTAFRIFILMATRRIKSDRFFGEDFNAKVYTPAGFAWVRDNGMRDVMRRHAPELAAHFADARSMFFPWAKGTAG